jgi:glycosyltransferase involved in cell wall biosynthesis
VPVLRSRSSPHRIGLRPATRVRSRLQARPVPRPPAPRLDGPTVVYVDVTSALDGGWRAGIQRVTVELVRRLPVVADVDVVAVRWSDPLGAYRRLDAAEWRSLLDPHHHPPPPASPGPGRRLAARLRRVLTRPPVVSRVVQVLRRRIQPARHAALELPRFEPGAVFLDVDASWNVVQAPRSELLPALHREGVRVAWFAHDLFPETHPEWFDPGLVRVFREHLRAHADHAEVVVCNSEHTAGQVRAFVTDRHPGASPRTVVVPLGADARPAPATAAGAATPDLPAAGPVLLTVGTVEPRKGHRHLLAAWDRIRAEHPGAVLVIAGRRGWHADDVAAAINDHPDLGRRLFWLTDLDDRALAAWYRRADLVVVPSLSEGYGLPVVEALGAGCAVLASDGGALAEVGGDRVRRFPAGDPEALAREATALLADPESVEDLRRRATTWEPPSWDDTARAVAAALGAEVFDTGDVPVPTARG